MHLNKFDDSELRQKLYGLKAEIRRSLQKGNRQKAEELRRQMQSLSKGLKL